MLSDQKLLSVKNLHTSFGDKIIHDDIDFSINKGEIVGLLGGSGTGKTILLRKMLGLIPLQRGHFFWEGQEVDIDFIKRKACMQFQKGALMMDLNVGENIMMPLLYILEMKEGIAKQIVLNKMKFVGLEMDDYYKKVSQLSGGMIKKVALARALVMDPELLFLDEPTAGLDTKSAGIYDNLILELNKNIGITVIMVTHDLVRVRNICDRILVLADSKIYSGTFEELHNGENENVKQFLQEKIINNSI